MHQIQAAVLLYACISVASGGIYTDRFNEQYKKIKDASNGYFSRDGVPYHSVETLNVESTDYGHETDSEAFGYYLFLEAMSGGINGDFSGFNTAWNTLEETLIPKLQPSQDEYDPNNVGSGYGKDPIFEELKSSYGTSYLYLMHWLADVDNRYGFGNLNGQCELGPTASGPSLINNGPGTLWSGITFPTCDTFKYGSTVNGFDWFSDYPLPAWQYSTAPNCDARAVQAAYWASQWAGAQGRIGSINGTLGKISKLGDYLRYSLFDRYFKKAGNCGWDCPLGTGKESGHYLLGWYVGFGGTIDPNGYVWHQGSYDAHSGHQNPMAAWALAHDPNLKPKSPLAVIDWEKSLATQLAFYKYAQTPAGLFAGGVTNSYNNNYETPPPNILNNNFNGLWYKEHPGVEGSSTYFTLQSWTADRLAQYYYTTDNEIAKNILELWVFWIKQNVKIDNNGYQVPEGLSYTGTPPNVVVKVDAYGQSVGIASSIARALAYYAAKINDLEAKALSKQLLDIIYEKHRDSRGVYYNETRDDYKQFQTLVNIPQEGWTGTYPNGDQINTWSTFESIRSWYQNDPDWYKVAQFINGGPAPVFNYHRFWEQCDYALAVGAYGLLFDE